MLSPRFRFPSALILAALLCGFVSSAFAQMTEAPSSANPGAPQGSFAGFDAPPPEGSEENAPVTPEMLQRLAAALASGQNGEPLAGDMNLSSLKQKFQNALVKIEFTAITNKEETKMNPTKSELYYADDEPPHGTGFFIGESEILTNAHVVEEARAGSIRIKSPATGGVEFKAEIVGVGGSEAIDLALLRLPADELLRFKKRSGLETIPTLDFGDSDEVRQADPIGIFGYPQSSDELKMIQAKVTGRQYLKISSGRFVCGHQFIEVGPGGVVQPGNSGGPALNRDGQVVGVPSRGAGYAMEQGWLIPSNIVLHFLDRVRSSDQGRKSLRLPRLGISLTNNFAGTAVWTGAPEDCVIFELGTVVREVTPNSLAADWGIKEGDIIVGFANQQQGLSCALDFEGYRVITGKMAVWPPAGDVSAPQAAETTATLGTENESNKLHLSEMVLCSNENDLITLWYVRKGKEGIQRMENPLQYKEPVPVPHLGTFEKPEFEFWGDFVAQDFNDYNVLLFEIPHEEIQKGGVLVTFVEPNSLASRRGMQPQYRPSYGFAYMSDYGPRTSWDIIETVNEKPVKSLAELQAALREAEKRLEEKKSEPGYDPARRILMKENYVQLGFRTNTSEGSVLQLKPAFPIDEALECRKHLTAAPASGQAEKQGED